MSLRAVSRPARRQALMVEMCTLRRAAISLRVSRPRARSRSAWLGRWWLWRRSSTIRLVKGLPSPELCPAALSAAAVWPSVWSSRSRSSRARVSGLVWRNCQAAGWGVQAGSLAAAEPDVQVDAAGLGHGDVVDEQPGHALAVALGVAGFVHRAGKSATSARYALMLALTILNGPHCSHRPSLRGAGKACDLRELVGGTRFELVTSSV